MEGGLCRIQDMFPMEQKKRLSNMRECQHPFSAMVPRTMSMGGSSSVAWPCGPVLQMKMKSGVEPLQ